MAAEQLSKIEDVDIDSDGLFKYVLIRMRPSTSSSEAEGKDIVRGYSWAEYHADIYDQVSGELDKLGFASVCVGGGRINHNSRSKKISVYGYSVGFGQADHSITTAKLKKKYPEYTVTWTNDGY